MTDPRDRFFVEGAHALGEEVRFDAADARKIARVLRLRAGDHVTVIDSAGRSYAALLRDDDGTTALLEATLERSDPEPRLQITLAQAIPKAAKMDLVVEKATEAGAVAVVPFRAARSVAEGGPGKVERWRRIARAAAQQAGRTRIPDVAESTSWEALLAAFARYDCVLLPWELADPVPLRERLPAVLADARSVLIVIGPEGGFTRSEAEAAVAAGASAISLGPRIFRTETAGLVAAVVALYASGGL